MNKQMKDKVVLRTSTIILTVSTILMMLLAMEMVNGYEAQFLNSTSTSSSSNCYLGNEASATYKATAGMKFTANESYNVTNVSVFFTSNSDSTAWENIQLGIHNDNGGNVGTLINQSYKIQEASANWTSAGYVNFTFPMYVPLVNQQKYWLVLNLTDISKYIVLRFGCDNTGADGYFVVSNDMGATWASGYDAHAFNVRIYADNPLPPVQTPALTLDTSLLSNINSTANPFTFYFNGTITNNSNGDYNCTLYINSSASSTKTMLNISQNQNFSVVTTGWQNVSNFNVTCLNANATGSFLRTNIMIDTVTPIINFGRMVNNSVLYRNIDLINFTMNFTDPNLFATNLTIYRLNSSGGRNYTVNRSFVQNVGLTTRIENFSLNPDSNVNVTNSNYMIEATAWDSHTANYVRPMPWYFANDSLIADGDIVFGGSFMELTGQGDPATYFYLSRDRYKLKMTFDDQALTHTVSLHFNTAVDYLPLSGYKGHFVMFDKGRWLDFQGNNVKTVQVTEVSAQDYVVQVEHYATTDEVEFESIGDLNTITSLYYFNITSGMTFFAQDNITGTFIQAFTVTVNSTPVQTRSATAGNVTFNITSGDYNVSITATGYTPNETMNLAFANGSSYNFKMLKENSLYLFLYDEITNQQINSPNGTVQIINQANVSVEYTNVSGNTFLSGFATGDYEIRYWVTGYTQRSYYTTISSSSTQSLRLYLLNSTPTTHTYKNLVVYDESSSPVANATVSMQRFFIDCNCYRTVEMTKTNDVGKSFLFTQLYDAVYIFSVSYLGETVKITSQTRLDTRDLYITVNLLDDTIAGFFEVANGVQASMTYNTTTGIWSYTWVDDGSLVKGGKLTVTRETMYGKDTLFTQQVNSTASTITYNMSSYINETGTFIAVGQIQSSTLDYFPVATKDISFTDSKTTFGMTGVFVSLILIMVLAMIGTFNPSVSVVLTILGFVASAIMGLIVVQVTWLVGIIIVGFIYMYSMRT